MLMTFCVWIIAIVQMLEMEITYVTAYRKRLKHEHIHPPQADCRHQKAHLKLSGFIYWNHLSFQHN